MSTLLDRLVGPKVDLFKYPHSRTSHCLEILYMGFSNTFTIRIIQGNSPYWQIFFKRNYLGTWRKTTLSCFCSR